MVERILANFDAAYDFKSVCLRYFNAAGAEQRLLGEGHQPEGCLPSEGTSFCPLFAFCLSC
jgi:UDP-glucose 4-epimerase